MGRGGDDAVLRVKDLETTSDGMGAGCVGSGFCIFRVEYLENDLGWRGDLGG